MRIAVLGAGAIGGFLGGRLARAGANVVLIARGPHLQAMNDSGLRVIEGGGDWTVSVEATDDFAAMRDANAVFVTLKAHSLPSVAERMAANLGHDTAVVSAQNGIPWWYFQRHGGELDGIHLETVDPGGVVARGCVELSRALMSAGLKAPVQPNIRAELWLKLLGNAVFNPLSALTRATLGDMAQSPLVAEVVRSAMQEVDAVARRLGIEVSVSIEQRIKGAARVGDHKTSMLQDLEAGRPMEIDALTGSVVELGDRLGIPVPHLRTLYASVKLLEKRSMRPADLLQRQDFEELFLGAGTELGQSDDSNMEET